MNNKLLTVYILSLITFIASLIIFIIDFGFNKEWVGFVSILMGVPMLGTSIILFFMGIFARYLKDKGKIKAGKILYSILLVISSLIALALLFLFLFIYIPLIILIIISNILIFLKED